jgi:molybdate transport system permease protein
MKRRRSLGGFASAAAAVGATFLVFPLLGLLLDAPLSSTLEVIARSSTRSALGLSLLVSFGALAIASIFGLPLAWVLARGSFAGRSLLRMLVLIPMIIPPVVAGVGLLAAFGPEGLVGGALDSIGLTLPSTTFAACLASAFVGMPFLVIASEAGFRSVDRGLEDAASSLGASPTMAFRRVTWPAAAPFVAAGATLCWVRAIGEFGATVTFAGDTAATRTASLSIYALLRAGNESGATVLSIIMLVLTVVSLLFLRAYLWPDERAAS